MTIQILKFNLILNIMEIYFEKFRIGLRSLRGGEEGGREGRKEGRERGGERKEERF
jgi:hypothetical protein